MLEIRWMTDSRILSVTAEINQTLSSALIECLEKMRVAK